MKNPSYAFSLSGDPLDYQGNYESRREARAAALEAVRSLGTPPGSIFVGRIALADPHVSGHARAVLREMSRRAQVFGEERYVSGLTVEQTAELDRELAATLTVWLGKHHLESRTFKVEAVSEYPLPTVPQVASGTTANEIHDIGPSQPGNDYDALRGNR